MIVEEDLYLEHYGKKGMKWGERKAAKQVRREGRAKKFDDKASNIQGKINAVDARIATTNRSSTVNQLKTSKEYLSKQRDSAMKDAAAKRAGKLSSGQKKALAVGVVAGAAAAGLILNRHQKVKVKNLRKTNAQFVEAKKLIDGKMQKRFSSLNDLSKMTSGDNPSRQGALKEINNLNSFYKTRLERMAKEYKVSPKDFQKMKLGGYQ